MEATVATACSDQEVMVEMEQKVEVIQGMVVNRFSVKMENQEKMAAMAPPEVSQAVPGRALPEGDRLGPFETE